MTNNNYFEVLLSTHNFFTCITKIMTSEVFRQLTVMYTRHIHVVEKGKEEVKEALLSSLTDTIKVLISVLILNSRLISIETSFFKNLNFFLDILFKLFFKNLKIYVDNTKDYVFR